MRKTNRIWMLLLAALLLAGLFGCKRNGAKGGSGETIRFDLTNLTDGIPDGWWINSYEGGYETFAEGGAFGFASLGADDLRLCRTVDVKPETGYVLSAEIRTENVRDGQGATLSIDNYSLDGCYLYSEALYGTNDWTQVALAFYTAESQEAVTLALRLGGYSSESDGSVWFRNVSLEETENAPVSFQNLDPDTGDEETEERTVEDYENVFTVIFWLGAITAIVLSFGFLYRSKALAALKDVKQRKYWIFAMIVLIGLAVRYLLCAKFKGHSTDIVCWQAWGERMATGGTRAFYVGNGFCDYPPGYMLICGFLYRISQLFARAPEPMRLFVYMFPAFLCDVLSGWLLLYTAKRFELGDRAALLLAGLIVLNPAAVFLSGAWGQIDSILTVMLIGTFLLLNASREKPYYRLFAGLLYGAAILIKWQALIFGPVLALMYVMTGVDQFGTKKFRDHVLWSIAAVVGAVGVLAIASAVFRGEGMGFFWMTDRFKNASGGYDYASVEGYNLLTLFGGNWAPMHERLADDKLGAALPMFGKSGVKEVFLKCNELFSRVALFIGLPTMIVRAWNRMRTRKDGETNREFLELIFTGAITALLALLRFTAKNYTSADAGTSALLKAISEFPLYGLFMIGLFIYLTYRACKGRRFLDWLREGGTTAVGMLTLAFAYVTFAGTWILSACFEMFGSRLTWHAYGVIGIVWAFVAAAGLFTIYWLRHRKTNYSLYVNRGLIFLLAACFMTWVFTFGHYMHERYIFPVLFLLAFAYAYDRDPKKLAVLCMLTVTTFMNEMTAMYVVSEGAIHMIRGGVLHNRMIDLISLLEVGTVMYLSATSLIGALAFDPSDPTGEKRRMTPQPSLKTEKRRTNAQQFAQRGGGRK